MCTAFQFLVEVLVTCASKPQIWYARVSKEMHGVLTMLFEAFSIVHLLVITQPSSTKHSTLIFISFNQFYQHYNSITCTMANKKINSSNFTKALKTQNDNNTVQKS